ncbi:MAG: 50S ribosomal protein L18 [Candidatus Diapherotrites archaeon]
MTKGKGKLKFRRRREGKTDFKKRLALLKSAKNRAVFRKSNKRIIMELVEFKPDGDKTLFSVNSSELKKAGFPGKCNIPSAYLAGYWLGKKAIAAGISEAIFDIGRNTPVRGGRAFAALKGLIDAGMNVPAGEQAFPSKERIEGQHIKKYAESLGEKKEKRFSGYAKEKISIESITSLFNEAKKKIDSFEAKDKVVQ